VWNQVSGDEIRAGYRRGRLSSAISKDDGKTWQHFRTIDRVVLPPAGRVLPDRCRAWRGGWTTSRAAADYGSVDYPTVEIVDDTVFLFWYRVVLDQQPADVTGRRLWVLPVSWFYGTSPVAAGPKLY